jgi:hypothetical protein
VRQHVEAEDHIRRWIANIEVLSRGHTVADTATLQVRGWEIRWCAKRLVETPRPRVRDAAAEAIDGDVARCTAFQSFPSHRDHIAVPELYDAFASKVAEFSFEIDPLAAKPLDVGIADRATCPDTHLPDHRHRHQRISQDLATDGRPAHAAAAPPKKRAESSTPIKRHPSTETNPRALSAAAEVVLLLSPARFRRVAAPPRRRGDAVLLCVSKSGRTASACCVGVNQPSPPR